MQLCLVFQIAGLEQLRQTMGELATDMALQRLSLELPALISTVLEHHSITKGFDLPEFEQGRCQIGFHLAQTDDLFRDAQFADQILLVAETRLLQAATAVFGYATARLADVQIALLAREKFADAQAVAAAFAGRYQQCALNDTAEMQLLDLLRSGKPRVFLQQIIDLRQPAWPVVGYEALARGPAGSSIERADQLFDTARRCGLTDELEKSCLRTALDWLPRLPKSSVLSVNISAGLLLENEVQQLLQRNQLWIELTEHLPLLQAQQLSPVLAQLTELGASIALDDIGCGYADLQAARALKPAVVKLCITVIRALAQSDAVVQELANTVQELHQLGCLVLAEGIETAEQLELIRKLDIDYAQGWYFGRPQPAEHIFGV